MQNNHSEDDKKKFEELLQFTDNLITDPGDTNMKKISGFAMGKSDKDGFWRLYFNASFDHFIEFKKEDTLNAKQESPGHVMVWLTKEADVKEMLLRTGKLEFLKGTIVSEYLRKQGGNVNPSVFSSLGRMRLMAAEGSGCATTGCSAGCSDGYGCSGGGDNPSVGFTCGC